MVGLAFEVHNTAAAAEKKGHGNDTADAELEAAEVYPSFLDIFHYTFCYIGIMTGNHTVLLLPSKSHVIGCFLAREIVNDSVSHILNIVECVGCWFEDYLMIL